jgi:exonuclease III
MMLAEKPEVLACQETKVGIRVGNNELSIAGYKLFRKDRNECGGGVALYVANHLNPVQIMSCIETKLELVAVKCKIGRSTCTVATFYRPPNYSLPDFYDQLSTFASSLAHDLSSLILTGDSNVCALSKEFQKMQDITSILGLKQLITIPTHHERLIDHIFVHQSIEVISSGIGSPIEKTHTQTWVKLLLCPIRRENKSITVWNYKKTDWELVNRELMKMEILK